jgi:Ca-activated chloride channel family protein
MKFLWPSAFVALALIPLLILLYLWGQRRRRRFAVRFSSVSLVRAALPAQSRLRRYLPMALLFLALASLVLSLARPVTVMQVPAGRATVMLVLDVSSSMRQNDISPSRIVAAQQAALGFIDKQKDTNQVGIVAFASIAQLVQAPTTDPEALENTIVSLRTGRGTAIGEGIITALDAITEFSQSTGAEAEVGTATVASTPDTEDEVQPDIIVLLTDGNYNAGIDPLEAAQQAADSGVRVYTIGYGTDNGQMDRNMMGRNTMGRNGNFGNFGLDEASLQTIASTTGGEYYTASSAGELQEVFDSLPTVLITREETLEISVVAAAVAALLVTGAVLLSQLWHPLP